MDDTFAINERSERTHSGKLDDHFIHDDFQSIEATTAKEHWERIGSDDALCSPSDGILGDTNAQRWTFTEAFSATGMKPRMIFLATHNNRHVTGNNTK